MKDGPVVTAMSAWNSSYAYKMADVPLVVYVPNTLGERLELSTLRTDTIGGAPRLAKDSWR